MDREVCYFFYKLYVLISGENRDKLFDYYFKMKAAYNSDIILRLPEEFVSAVDRRADIAEIKNIMKPYVRQSIKDLEIPVSAAAAFEETLKKELNDYDFKNGVLRKCRRERLFIIEPRLTCEYKTGPDGMIYGKMIRPLVRIADTPLKKDRKKTYRRYSVAGGRDPYEVTFTDIKLYEPKAFCKTMRHLEIVEIPLENIDESITDEQARVIAKSAAVAGPVCENRAIPRDYLNKCRYDIPPVKALTVLGVSFLIFMLLTFSIALLSGLAVFIIFGFSNVFGLLREPVLYLVTAFISIIYAIRMLNRLYKGRF